MGQVAEDVTAPVKEAASEAVKAAGDVPFVAPADCLTHSCLPGFVLQNKHLSGLVCRAFVYIYT